MNKIVVYSGSFCPPTMAHFELLLESMKKVGADHGCFLPTCDENIKNKMIEKMERLNLSGEVRMKMLNSFCEEHPEIEVCDYEIKTHDSDNTYETFRYLQQQNPESELYYIMGADKLRNLPHWKNIDKFLSEFNFIVFDRADLNGEAMIDQHPLLSKYKGRFVILPELNGLSMVSSSRIRELFVEGDEDYKKYLYPTVARIMEGINLMDYPEISVYDYIGLKLTRGPHGVTAACRKVYLLNKELLKTVDLSEMMDNIELYDYEKNVKLVKKYETKVVLEDKEYYDLVKDYENPLVIVESSYARTGGKYDQGGSDTLEEELCRITSLSSALYKYGDERLKCVRESGKNEENIYPLKREIFVPNVKILRWGKGKNYRRTPDLSKRVSVVMVPSLNFTKKDKINDLNYEENGQLNEDGINIMKNRLKTAFSIAFEKGYETVIINAFGSGFHIPLTDCALILSDVICEFDGCFKTIVINNKQKGKCKKEFYPYLNLRG